MLASCLLHLDFIETGHCLFVCLSFVVVVVCLVDFWFLFFTTLLSVEVFANFKED